MATVRQTQSNRLPIMWLAAALALVAALIYVLIALDILAVGDLTPAEDQASVIYVAAGSYLVGGLLILLRNRWLWVVGAVMNALVILFFFQQYQNRPEVALSAGGLVSTATQLLLEVTLLYLIISDWFRSRRQSE
jgi:hypothetical protein